MTNIAAQRIQREFREVAADEALMTQYFIEATESNLLNLKGYVNGPPDTPYEGGRYYLEMNIPETYPFSPPKVSCITYNTGDESSTKSKVRQSSQRAPANRSPLAGHASSDSSPRSTGMAPTDACSSPYWRPSPASPASPA